MRGSAFSDPLFCLINIYMKGWIYLMCQVDIDGNELYKIGVSKNDPEKRVKSLQTGNPNKILLLNKYSSSHYNKIERWLHRKFFIKKTLANNEWFALTSNQAVSFLSECKLAESNIDYLLLENPFYK